MEHQYIFNLSGNIFQPESYTLIPCFGQNLITGETLYPNPISPELNRMLDQTFIIKMDVSRKPFKIYTVDKQFNHLAGDEIVLWMTDAVSFIGEHMRSGFIVEGYINGDLTIGAIMYLSMKNTKFDLLEFSPETSNKIEMLAALKEKWCITMPNSIKYMSLTDNNREINTKIEINGYNYHCN